ncbi:hypothetical protein TWF225_005777 [Orbilia oligospora]|nr:hypothetical protein TWF225_005777 [Orbilia oligospora]KAF3293565.1 hypothetical protein TWF132_004533 [Orbilia oligospora]
MNNTALTAILPSAITYAGTTHATYAAAIAYARDIQDPAERMQYVTYLRGLLAPLVDKVREGVEALVAAIETEGWEQAYASREDFVEEWGEWIDIAKAERKRRDNRCEALEDVKKNWGQETCDMLIAAYPNGAGNFWRQVATLSKEVDYAAAMRIVTRLQHEHITRQQKGRRFVLNTDIRTVDISKAIKSCRQYKKDPAPVSIRQLTTDELGDISCYLYDRGMFCKKSDGIGSMRITDASTPATLPSMVPSTTPTSTTPTPLTLNDSGVSMSADEARPIKRKRSAIEGENGEEEEDLYVDPKRSAALGFDRPTSTVTSAISVTNPPMSTFGPQPLAVDPSTGINNPSFFQPMNPYPHKPVKARRLSSGDMLRLIDLKS